MSKGRSKNMSYIIRKKERKDCKDIAHVVTVAWNETYKGIVPDEFLNNLYTNEEQRPLIHLIILMKKITINLF